jgi:hypothetical protein
MPLWGLTFPDTGLSLAGLKGELSLAAPVTDNRDCLSRKYRKGYRTFI